MVNSNWELLKSCFVRHCEERSNLCSEILDVLCRQISKVFLTNPPFSPLPTGRQAFISAILRSRQGGRRLDSPNLETACFWVNLSTPVIIVCLEQWRCFLIAKKLFKILRIHGCWFQFLSENERFIHMICLWIIKQRYPSMLFYTNELIQNQV